MPTLLDSYASQADRWSPPRILGAVGGGASGGVSSVTWDVTNKNAHAVLSNGNRTVTTDGGSFTNYLGYATASGSISGTQKPYWEITCVSQSAADTCGIGVMTALGLGNAYLGQSANSLGAFPAGDYNFNGSNFAAALAAFAVGAVVCVAVNYAAAKIWFRVNGGNWNNDVIANQNPATGAGGISIALMTANGPIFPAYNLQTQSTSDAQTANFGSSFTFTPPAGFTGFP